MGAISLDTLSWPEVRSELEAGRDAVVVALGATEQHGPHLPLATDALIGDRLAWLVAERLDAFVAPTIRIGCSSHHLAFPGTLSFSDETFHGVVTDLIQSLARGGFGRVVLLPTHGGNFGPLGTALERLGPVPGIEIQGLTDVRVLLAIAQLGAEEHGVSMGAGGLHAGEWETSMIMAIHPELVHLDKGEAGYTGDLEHALGALFGQGVDAIASSGVIGDPAASTVQHGERYWAKALEVVMAQIGSAQDR
jgi:creatinine amidohydrolase/Fe(II)-dependent formamide hydrolase-like protein